MIDEHQSVALTQSIRAEREDASFSPSSAVETRNQFWHGTLVENYNYLMSEELISQCQESFRSLADLSFQEFEEQRVELIEWCERVTLDIEQVKSNGLISYLRQDYYEDLHEQGLTRLRLVHQHAEKLIDRFGDLKDRIDEQLVGIDEGWKRLEDRFLRYFDVDLDRLIEDLNDAFLLFEQWIDQTDEELRRLKISPDRLLIVQEEIKSRNPYLTSLIDICQRLKGHSEPMPWQEINELQTRWHELWIHSVEIQCQLEERRRTSDDDDVIPFDASEYEKILDTSLMSLPTVSYYSLTNIDGSSSTSSERTRSKFDAGYASEDERCSPAISCLSRCRSDPMIYRQRPSLVSSFTPGQSCRYSINSAYENRRVDVMSNSYDASEEYTDAETSSGEMSKVQRKRFSRSCSTFVEINARFDPGEPCWDGYQNPLFYSVEMDSMETIFKWEELDPVISLPSTRDCSFGALISARRVNTDSDSDLDDFNEVIDETERQLNKARLTLERKKRPVSSPRVERQYDELFRTCQTNIECLRQILANLPRSSNARLNSTQAIEQLESYLATWYVMREQVDEARTRARRLLHLSQEIIRFKRRVDDESSRLRPSLDHEQQICGSLTGAFDELQQRLLRNSQARQKLALFRSDLSLVDEHLRDFGLSSTDRASLLNLEGYLHCIRVNLTELTNEMESQQNELRTLLTQIDDLLRLEDQLDDEEEIDVDQLQTLIETYERLIPVKSDQRSLSSSLSEHCQSKVNLYRTMLGKAQQRHIASVNMNNNNSSTPPDYFPIPRKQRDDFFSPRRERNLSVSETTASATTSYISDDCKVLYIETVIEVSRPVFYERTTDTHSTRDTRFISTPTSTQRPLTSMTSNHHSLPLTDDELPQNSSPVNSSANHSHRRTNGDDDERRTNSNQFRHDPRRPMFPPAPEGPIPQSSLARRFKELELQEPVVRQRSPNARRSRVRRPSPSLWQRFLQRFFTSLFLGLLILLIVFLVFLFRLDTCSRSTLLVWLSRQIVRIESEGRPPI